MTSPTTASAPSSPASDEQDTTSPRSSLGDATELAGKSIGAGVADGTGEVAGGIKGQLPITAGAVQETGQVSGETVSAVAEAVAEAIRVLPLEVAEGGG